MFGAISAAWMESSLVYQLKLPLDTPPMISIDDKYLTSVDINIDMVDNSGEIYAMRSSKDHPTFEANRNWLDSNGYIKMNQCWINGDVTTKPFYLNGHYFDVGDNFVCASAMLGHLKYR